MLGVETAYYVSRALDVNYAAFAYAVYGPIDEINAEYAINRVDVEAYDMQTQRDIETREMVRLKSKGHTYQQMALLMGKGKDTIWQRVKKWEAKQNEQSR